MGVTYNYGAGPTYTKIASQTLGSGTVNVTFSNIPQNYTDLLLVCSVQGTSTTDRVWIRFNSDSGANYSWTRLTGNGSSAGSSRYTSQPAIETGDFVPNSGSSFLISTTNIQNYSNSTTYKTTLTRYSIASNFVAAVVGLWRNTNAITSITSRMSADNNTLAGSTFTLYGVAAALKPKATGGDITTDGTYFIHTFRTSGVFQPNQNITADYLVVAGGGGGGADYVGVAGTKGGGGAGGLRSTVTATGGGGSLESALSLTAGTSYTVTVGAGGAAASTSSNTRTNAGANGNNSVFSTITSTGGGGGAGGGYPATNGGSGGGAGYGNGTTTAGTFTANQGYAGGAAVVGANSGGGGGGAGAVGSAGRNTGNGGGGTGVAVSITGTSVTYAGGGGAGAGDFAAGAGGTGGGGAGGVAGTSNTGGGGGGNAAGGSGIVIIRYSA